MLLSWNTSEGPINSKSSIKLSNKDFQPGPGIIGIIGAGNFTNAVILPALKKLGAEVKWIASSRGLSGTVSAKKFNIPNSTTDYREILEDPAIGAVIITTQHHTHATMAMESLKAGKHVFVEKPLVINKEELDALVGVYQASSNSISVGFNRRFSPFLIDIKRKLGNLSQNPIHVIATMNAGFIPNNHWTQDPEIGGGRIIGEACHLIDVITYLTDSLVDQIVMNALGNEDQTTTDNATLILKYKNGSNGVINYFSNGHKTYSKERIEIYAQGKTLIVDNFRKSTYYGLKGRGLSRAQDKGHFNQFKRFLEGLKANGSGNIPFEQIFNTTASSFAALDSLREGKWIEVPPFSLLS